MAGDCYTPAVFVTFEGPDGAGKSTAMRGVADFLRSQGLPVRTTRQPGDCSIGPDVRRLLLEGQSMTATAELFLYLADRSQNVAEVIRPSLDRSEWVLCDRYSDSTLVYQGYARGLEVDLLRRLNDLATGGLKPDRTVLLDLDPEVGLGRIAQQDRLDREPIEFHRRVRQGFLSEAAREPERWRIVDAAQPVEAVVAACLAALE